ncbi:MAG: cytochrome c3 family protein [Polyangiaceae bacterium]|nr:cytochrome c3 family protein [Polyangiaceae bacterium]
MQKRPISLALIGAVSGAALVAACGGSSPAPEVPPAPSATAPAPTAPPPASTAAVTPPPPASSAPETPPPPAKKAMPEVAASKLADDLKAIGLDIAKLPKMSALKADQRSKVMPLLKKATGMDCKDCHADKDFKKETPHKAIARKMWDEFVVPMKLASGPVFCDSCHQGGNHFLDRKDKDAVGGYMDAQFVKKLARKDGKEVKCETCHVDMEMKIFEKLWKTKMQHASSSDVEEARSFVLGMR